MTDGLPTLPTLPTLPPMGATRMQDKVEAAEAILGQVRAECLRQGDGERVRLMEQYGQVAEAYIELAAMPVPPPSSDKVETASMPLPGKVRRRSPHRLLSLIIHQTAVLKGLCLYDYTCNAVMLLPLVMLSCYCRL